MIDRPIPPTPRPPPLFAPFPPTTMEPIYAWRAYTNPQQSVVGTLSNPSSLSVIPQSIVAMVWYHSLYGETPVRKTLDYGDARPYTFRMPDGSTRINNSPMSEQAYANIVQNLKDDADVHPGP